MTEHHLIVWYNTRCPVCDAGVGWQRNKLLAAVRAGHLSFHDINEQPQALAAYRASLDDVRRRLHATDKSGRLIVGADVAIAIWRSRPQRLAGIAVRQSGDAAGHALCLRSFRGSAVRLERRKGRW